MSDFTRINRLIREAGVQRSATIGESLGTFIADTWLGTADAARKAVASLRGEKSRPSKAVPAR